MLELNGPTFGRYQILEQIGRGGNAMVFKGYDSEQDRHVALKILMPSMHQDPQFWARFQREAKVVSRLKHPHIVPVQDFGEVGGNFYLAMPLYSIGSLATRLNNGHPTPKEGALLVGQIASALDYAHRQGVIHRDVKPSNILIDDKGNALLSDFGLVYVQDASLSLTGSAIIGTPGYISPEQAYGKKVDARADQYSLGILIYQMAAGKMPFEGDTPIAVLLRQINGPVPSPRSVSPVLPELIERIILKAIEKNPEDRFASVKELNDVFQTAMAHVLNPEATPPPKIKLAPPKNVQAPIPNTADEQSAKRWRKIRTIGALALLLLLLLACSVLSANLFGNFERNSNATKGNAISVSGLNIEQLTAMSGTIEALSTEVAAAQTGTIYPDQIQTVVIQTVIVAFTPIRSATEPGTVLTPTLSVTPTRESSTIMPSPVPSQSFSLTATRNPSPTPSQPTSTPFLPSPTAYATPAATTTAETDSTATSIPLPTATAYLSPTPTATSITPPPPSPTRTPTSTPTLEMTPTPTPTATPDPCSGLSLTDFQIDEEKISWTMANNGVTTVKITGIYLDWPNGNEELQKIILGGREIWDQEDDNPPTTIHSGWQTPNRRLSPGESKSLIMEFAEDAASSGYDLVVTLDNGCQISDAN